MNSVDLHILGSLGIAKIRIITIEQSLVEAGADSSIIEKLKAIENEIEAVKTEIQNNNID